MFPMTENTIKALYYRIAWYSTCVSQVTSPSCSLYSGHTVLISAPQILQSYSCLGPCTCMFLYKESFFPTCLCITDPFSLRNSESKCHLLRGIPKSLSLDVVLPSQSFYHICLLLLFTYWLFPQQNVHSERIGTLSVLNNVTPHHPPLNKNLLNE